VDAENTQLVRTNKPKLWIMHVLNEPVGVTWLTDASVLEVPPKTTVVLLLTWRSNPKQDEARH
jgi:hypothetical protein